MPSPSPTTTHTHIRTQHLAKRWWVKTCVNGLSKERKTKAKAKAKKRKRKSNQTFRLSGGTRRIKNAHTHREVTEGEDTNRKAGGRGEGDRLTAQPTRTVPFPAAAGTSKMVEDKSRRRRTRVLCAAYTAATWPPSCVCLHLRLADWLTDWVTDEQEKESESTVDQSRTITMRCRVRPVRGVVQLPPVTMRMMSINCGSVAKHFPIWQMQRRASTVDSN